MAVRIDVEKCEGCGECVDVCATGAISIVDEKAVVKEDDCCECMVCQNNCAQQAILDPA